MYIFLCSDSQTDKLTIMLAQENLSHKDHALHEEADNVTSATDLGWKVTEKRQDSNRHVVHADVASDDDNDGKPGQRDRRLLLTELAARLARDKQLRYAERELEMQRLMMGKGSRRKEGGRRAFKKVRWMKQRTNHECTSGG